MISSSVDLTRSPAYLADAIFALEPRTGCDKPQMQVAVNSRVTVLDRTNGDTEVFTLVQAAESAVGDGQLSCLSPLGIRLLGCTIGDRVKFRFMGCPIDLWILDVANS